MLVSEIAPGIVKQPGSNLTRSEVDHALDIATHNMEHNPDGPDQLLNIERSLLVFARQLDGFPHLWIVFPYRTNFSF